MTNVYGFHHQLNAGKRGERFIDSYFADAYKIYQPDLSFEKIAGIDRIWTDKRDKRVLGVEYKTDETAIKTGNVFLETISVASENQDKICFG